MPFGRTSAVVLAVTTALGLSGWVVAPGARADHSQPLVAAVEEPAAPTDAEAVADDASLHITWSGPVVGDGVVAPVEHFDVTLRPTNPATPVPPVVTVDGDAAAGTVSSLVNGETYDVEVTARNDAGSSAPDTASGTPRTVPGAPTLHSVNPGNASAVVQWDRPAHNGGATIGRYVITSSAGVTKSVAGDLTSTRVSGLENGVATTFTVTAGNVAGNGTASGRSPAVIPRAPARLVIKRQPTRRVVYGTPSRVRAALVTPAGVGIPGQRVDLRAKRGPSAQWRRVASGTTGTSGGITLRTRLRATSALRLRHPAGAVAASSRDVRSVVVANRVTASPERTRTREGQRLVVRGRIAPAHPAGSTVRLQRRVSGSWTNVASGRMTTRRSYVVRWRPQRVGRYPLRVVKPGDAARAAGVSRTWHHRVVAETAADVAVDILRDRGITLATVHLSAGRDGATARDNVVDVADGRNARRSCYGGGPCGSTPLDIRVLRAVRAMGRRGTLTVSEFAGGSHASGSDHYSGRAVDITWVNGNHVGWGASYWMAVDVCRAYGAKQVMHPANDPWGGHSRHVHCGW